MSIPEDLRFLESHEWHRLDDNIVTIGISRYAADELTDITYVDLPEIGTAVQAGTPFGEIESVKATAELSCGVTGTVTEVNERLADEPELVNNDPYGDAWMIRLRVKDSSDFDKLMGPADYGKHTGG